MGPCLTDAAPEAAPDECVRGGSRYAEARTSTSAIAAAACVGGFISTSLQLCWDRRRHLA
jgi:hypothetical protein